MGVLNIVLFLLSLCLSFITIPLIYGMLIANNCTALNFKKQKIPVGMGIVFIIVQTFVIFLYTIYIKIEVAYVFSYIISILLIGIVGIVDDIIGEKEVKGFRGHVSSLLKGRLTTGGLKLIIGGIAATLVSLIISQNIIDLIMNVLIIGLFTNLINLFDLRPGRASKAFIILAIVLILTASSRKYNYIVISLLGIIFVYMPYDLKAKSMMGDTGSNVLGMTLGVFCAGTQILWIKTLYLALLVIIHIVSEYSSLTEIIDNNRLLCYIDKLGR